MTAVSVFKPQQCFGVLQMEQALEGPVRKALWPCMRTAAQAWNDSQQVWAVLRILPPGKNATSC